MTSTDFPRRLRRMKAAAAACFALAAGPAGADTPLQALQKQQAVTPPKSAPEAAVLLQAFQDICLNRFPNRAAVDKLVADRHLPPAGKAAREQALLAPAGDAWTIAVPKGTLLVTLLPDQGCAVAGLVQSAADINSNFDSMVTRFAASHALGPVVRTAPHYTHVHDRTATVQLLNVAPKAAPRQAFVNLDVLNPDTTTLARFTRTVAGGH